MARSKKKQKQEVFTFKKGDPAYKFKKWLMSKDYICHPQKNTNHETLILTPYGYAPQYQ